MAKIGVIITSVQAVYDPDEEREKVVITLEANHQRLPSILTGETEKDYIERSKRQAERMNMLENLHLGNALLVQKPVKIKPSFDDF